MCSRNWHTQIQTFPVSGSFWSGCMKHRSALCSCFCSSGFVFFFKLIKSLCWCGVLTVCFLFFVFVLYSFLTICKKKKKRSAWVGAEAASGTWIKIQRFQFMFLLFGELFLCSRLSWWTRCTAALTNHTSAYGQSVNQTWPNRAQLHQVACLKSSIQETSSFRKHSSSSSSCLPPPTPPLLLLLSFPSSSCPPLLLLSPSSPPPLLLLPSYSSTVSAPLISRSLTHLTFHFLSCDFTPRWQWSSMRR